MVRLILTISFVMFFGAAFCQSVPDDGPQPLTKRQWRKEGRNHKCIYRNTYTPAQRSAFYPFNKAMGIQIVSFDTIPDWKDRDVPDAHKLPVRNDTVCYSMLMEVKLLSVRHTDALTDILYNVRQQGPTTIETFSQCFIPRNAILFLDSAGKMIEYIEICFACDRYAASSEKIDMGEFCEGKYTLLKAFFVSAGIKKGLSEELVVSED